ncbi:MAG: PAS domain S-box protein, partial [Nitrospirota bacterium]
MNRAQAVGNIGSWRLDIRRNELTWSDENHRIFGIPKGTPMTYETFLSTVHPDDREYVDRKWTAALRGEHYDIEHRIIVEGQIKWVREKAYLEFDKNGELLGGFGTTQDITERKKAEGALHYEREKLINILDSIPDGVYIVNEQYDIDYVNPTIQKVLGPVKKGQKCYEYLEDQKKVCSWCKDQEVFKDKKTCRWEWYSPKTQKTYDLIDTPLINPDGSISKLEIFRDISERKRMEELLRKSRDEMEIRVQERTAELSKAYKEFEAFFNSSLTPLVFLDRDFNFMRVNEAYAKACQRDISEFPGHNHFEYYPHEENEAIFKRVVETKVPFQIFAKPFVFPDHPEWGVTYWDWTLTPISDPNGEVDFLVFALNDVTKRKQAEMAIKESEKKYRILIEQASDGIVLLDKELNVIDANSMVSEITGYSREELLNMNTRDIMPPDELASIAPSLKRVLSGETVVEERKLTHKSGSHIFIDVSVKMLENRLIQVIFRDITQRKEIESRIHTTNRLLELFAKTSSRKEYLDSVVDLLHEWTGCRCIGIRVLDKEGNIPYESYRGFSLDFWQQENWISVKNHQCACIRVVLQRPDPQDMKMMTPNGSFRCNNTEEFARSLTEKGLSRYRGLCIQTGFKSIAIVPIHYKRTILGAFHIADTREEMVPLEKIEFIESVSPLIGEAILRFSAEEELLRSEARLAEAQRVAHLGNWDWNIQTNQLYWSDEIYHIFGLSALQFSATYDAFLDSVHPEDRESVKKAVNEALYEKKPFSIDHRIVL